MAVQEGDHVQRSGNEDDKWKTEVANGCKNWKSRVSSFQVACTHMKYVRHHAFCCCLRQCQVNLGMVKRVRDVSISLDDYGSQKLEVVR